MAVDNCGIINAAKIDCTMCRQSLKSPTGKGWIICMPTKRYITYDWDGGSVDAVESCPQLSRKCIGK